ncbi:CotH kinase family protein [Glycomyces tenuis]|uniref:CotH kinase family protein n=1 Tax=Glycomyces tenuis TaxID=58116 RepID=UPI0003FCA8F9|nr:CotH kinase family protein [Glycomyces tenuis]
MAARAIRHRIPVSLRHRWRLVAGSVGLIAALILVVGSLRVTALVYSDAAEGFTVNWDVQGTVDLFDTSVAHEISLEYDEDDYREMAETFEDTGEKEWIKADITIDGVTIADVGIRLKGNSTLQGLGGGGEQPGGEQGGDRPPGGGQDGGQPPAGGQGGEQGGGGQEGGIRIGAPDLSLSFDEPEALPWLVDFSKYVDGQVYQGNRQISLRVESAREDAVLTEAVAAEAVEASGQPSYDWTYSTVSVNGSDAVTRRVVDIMDVTWVQEEFGADDGVLYKGSAGQDFAYQGEDPDDYEDDFKQVNMEGAADMRPIVDFLQWYDSADDETFAAELDEWFDIESLASYVALQNLLVNGDDMGGPGSNYYLWHDFETGLFSVIAWDLDLVLQNADLAPEELPSMMRTYGPGGEAPPEGAEIPEDAVIMGPGDMGGLEFKERFLDVGAFDEAYMQAYDEFYERIYAGGAALEAVETAASAAELNGADGVAESVESLTAIIQDRTAFLEAALAK